MRNLAAPKNYDFVLVSDFTGYNSSRDKTNIIPNVMVSGSKNVYKKLSGTIAVRQGQKRRGEPNTTVSPCSSSFVWYTSWGATYTMVISDSKLWVVIDDVWYTLQDNLTETRYVFDKWWDNTEKKDRTLFVNSTSDMFSWSGGYALAAAQVAGGSTLTLANASGTWAQAGFSTTSGQKQFFINGSATVYTYTGGETTNTLTGITPALPTINANDVILQSVITHTNKPAAGFSADFIKVINNQAYVGSYTSRLCYISKNTDFTDYTVPSPAAPGDPELLTLDSTLNGIGVRQGNAYISFGSNSWAEIVFSSQTDGSGNLIRSTAVNVKPVSGLQGAYAHEFIANTGDNIIYLAKDQQVRIVGSSNNSFTTVYPSISQEIATELASQNFEGGSLTCIGEFTYVCAPSIGQTYLYQVRQTVDGGGQVVAERLWHSPFVWNVTKVDEINGTVVGFSNANPQIYDLWDTGQWFDDSPSEEELPYECVLAFSYREGPGMKMRRQGLMSFDKHFTEGYITAGTTLNLQLLYNYEGFTASTTQIVNSPDQPAYLFSPTGNSLPSFGDSPLGDEPLGDATSDGGSSGDPTELVKFKCINSVAQQNVFEYQPILYSNTANSQWEILAVGDNSTLETEQVASFIINK